MTAASLDGQQISLRGIHLPADVSLWPLAPGWWVLLLLLLAGLVALVAWYRHYRRQAFRREALILLAQIAQQRDLPPSHIVDALSALLKRVAITAHGREAAAGRSGDEWLMFLDETGKTRGFTQGPGRSLGTHRFQPEVTLDAPALIALCRDWIKKQSC